MCSIPHFMMWWNRLSQKNGKLKLRTQRKAADFVRRMQNENGGPNAKIWAMLRKYEEINHDRNKQ